MGLVELNKDPFFAFVLAIDGCEKRAEVEAEELRALAKDLFGEATGRWVVSACGSVPGVSLTGPPAPSLAFADAQALLSDAGCLRLSTYPVGLTCFMPSKGHETFMPSKGHETKVEVIRQAPDGQGIEAVGFYQSF